MARNGRKMCPFVFTQTIGDLQGFKNSKKNSFGGEYSRKYGTYKEKTTQKNLNLGA